MNGTSNLPRLDHQLIAERRERQVLVGGGQRARRDVGVGDGRGREVARNVEVEERAQPAAELDPGTADEGAALGGLLPEEGAVDLQPPAGEKDDRAVAAAQKDPVRKVADRVCRGERPRRRVLGAARLGARSSAAQRPTVTRRAANIAACAL